MTAKEERFRKKGYPLSEVEIKQIILDAAEKYRNYHSKTPSDDELVSASRQFTLYASQNGYQIDRDLLNKVKDTKKNPLEMDSAARSIFDFARREQFPSLPVLPRTVNTGLPGQSFRWQNKTK